MAAHHQAYVFQVEIHALWGNLLAAFAVFRFFTYFFLYLRPPASILPGRPPTEALASLCLTSGGVVFILSTEQVTFAAMRHGFDDVMVRLQVSASLSASAETKKMTPNHLLPRRPSCASRLPPSAPVSSGRPSSLPSKVRPALDVQFLDVRAT